MSSSPGQDDMKVSKWGVNGGPISDLPHHNRHLDKPGWERQQVDGVGTCCFSLVALGQGPSRCGGPALFHRAALKITPPHLPANWGITRDSLLTHIADEVVGTVGLPSNHSQGLRHHETALQEGGKVDC